MQTELTGAHQASDPRAIALAEFITETMEILRTQPEATEILVDRVHALRFAAEQGRVLVALQGDGITAKSDGSGSGIRFEIHLPI